MRTVLLETSLDNLAQKHQRCTKTQGVYYIPVSRSDGTRLMKSIEDEDGSLEPSSHESVVL